MNIEDRKSTSKGCFSLGFAMISWMSRKKTYVAINAVKEEYIVANLAICEVVWLQKLKGRVQQLNFLEGILRG